MKKYIIMSIVSVLLLLLSACNNEEETVTLRFGHAVSGGSEQSTKSLEKAKSVEEQTDGRVKFYISPNSQLSSETEMLQQLDVGAMNGLAIMIGSMQTMEMRL